jgi:hypothetical protein
MSGIFMFSHACKMLVQFKNGVYFYFFFNKDV